ncbi:MAG TPA: CocE/NonD family hydrolase C-terminal non-catalytic domain-containing protein [Burkholderiales bacterium]|nr:CocE/NonD family hydrolase C-terminal non-catalytic domain-containing protein [Burkholderiales bacterium]
MPLTKGWLRASHRKTDPVKSTPYRPFHPHNERWWLEPNKPVECQIEIWPTCIETAGAASILPDRFCDAMRAASPWSVGLGRRAGRLPTRLCRRDRCCAVCT